MGNEFISIKNIARKALPRLIENLVFPNLIYKDYSSDFVVGKGATIQVRKPVILKANEFNPGEEIAAQDIDEKSVEVTLDKLATVDVKIGAISRATDIDDIDRLFIEPAAAALAEKINADGLELYKDIPYFTGTAGVTPDGLDDFANAAEVLDNHKAPTALRRGVWSPAAMAKFRQIGDIVNAEKSGATEALRAGSIGNIFGIDNYMTQGVKTHASGKVTAGGTGATGTKVKADVSEKTEFIAISNASANGTLTGAYTSGTILTIGSGASAVKAVVKSARTDNNEMTITVHNPISISTGDAISVTAASVENLVFHENAFAFVTRPLATPAGTESYTTNYNGISLRVTRAYDITTKQEIISMDVLYGYKTMYPELAVRVLG